MNILIQKYPGWLRFSEPVEVLEARTPDEVLSCLARIEDSGLWAAGFISYEAAGAFDGALKTGSPGDLPLLLFGLFNAPETRPAVPAPLRTRESYQLGEWRPSVTREEYTEAIAQIKEHIAAGDTYQVNYTFRLNADFSGSPFSFFRDLAEAQQGRYAAFIETDDSVICSASPELFFEINNGVITSRPMKGTRARGRTSAADRAAAEALQRSEKDRAENIMIVDMIRNDIGRVAVSGSVETLSRFDVEKYPTVWQMTSTVQGNVKPRMNANQRGGTMDVLKAMFPCSSVTGAPKAGTMEIIRELEKGPRGVYTGSIGWMAPDGSSHFNVAIRTAVLDRNTGRMEYGIGGGIVWDSDADSEYEEALSKAEILTRRLPGFQLLETLLCEPGRGCFLPERHLERLADSAAYFDFRIDAEKIRAHLRDLQVETDVKIRLLLNRDGTFDIRQIKLRPEEEPCVLAVANEPVDSDDVFLYHKTTNRAVYERAKTDFPDADDVLLYNEHGEITESTIANVVVELDGKRITPPVCCGLLAGTFRAELLERGEIEEGRITLADLRRAENIRLINSVRKGRRAVLQDGYAQKF